MRPRRRTPVAVLGPLAVILAATPIAIAAAASARVSFAQNAGRVDGFRASSSPRPSTLLALDRSRRFAASALPSLKRGRLGPQGPPGPAGPGGTSAVGWRIVTASGTTFGNDRTAPGGTDPTKAAAAFAACQPGEHVVGGGFKDLTRTTSHPAANSVDEVQASEPVQAADGTPIGWFVKVLNVPPLAVLGVTGPKGKMGPVPGPPPADVIFTAYAICLS
ncbi:MAG: hypothetical protein DLM64_13990 [Solirubrobacterales bacterium]|nr:MAG: hypothetical protein DLM64_13990 [Solirubrobacterales bacterium]